MTVNQNDNLRNILLYGLFTTFILVFGILLNQAFSGIKENNKDLQDFKDDYYKRHEILLQRITEIKTSEDNDSKKLDEIAKDLKSHMDKR
jgi:hypothetical protein